MPEYREHRTKARLMIYANGNIDLWPGYDNTVACFDSESAKWIRDMLVMNRGQPEPEPTKTQVGGDHYAKHAIQPWDAIREWYGDEGFETYLAANAVKYLARYRDKNGAEDIRKAAHYCERLIEHLEGRDK